MKKIFSSIFILALLTGYIPSQTVSAASGSLSHVSIADSVWEQSFTIRYETSGNENYSLDFYLIKNNENPVLYKTVNYNAAQGRAGFRRETIPYSALTYNSTDTYKARVVLRSAGLPTVLNERTSSNAIAPDSGTLNSSCTPNLRINGTTVSSTTAESPTVITMNSPSSFSYQTSGNHYSYIEWLEPGTDLNWAYIFDNYTLNSGFTFGPGTLKMRMVSYTSSTSNTLCGSPRYFNVDVPYPTPAFSTLDLKALQTEPAYEVSGRTVVGTTPYLARSWSNDYAGVTQFTYSVDGDTPKTLYSYSTLNLSAYTEGAHTVTFQVCNKTNCSTQTKNIYLDKTNPVIAEPSNLHNKYFPAGTQTMNITCSEETTGCKYLGYTTTDYVEGGVSGFVFPTTGIPAGFTSCNPSTGCAIELQSSKYVRVQGIDNAGRRTNATYLIKFDTTPPTLLRYLSGTYGYDSSTDTYITSDRTPTVVMNSSDSQSGIQLASCAISQNGTTVANTCTGSGTYKTLSYTPQANLADGVYTFGFNVRDNTNNPSGEATLRIRIDSTAPGSDITPEDFPVIIPGSSDNTTKVTFNIPSFSQADLDDLSYITLGLQTQNSQTYFLNNGHIDGTDARFTTVPAGWVEIRPGTDGNWPTSITLKDLQKFITVGEAQQPAIYTPTFTLYDRAGNPTPIILPPVIFDTIAPVINSVAATPESIGGGTGAIESPYLIGASSQIELTLNLTEENNGTGETPSFPLTVITRGVQDGAALNIAGEGSPHICETNSSTNCIASVRFGVPVGLEGPASIAIMDSVGNISSSHQMYFKQSNSVPTVTNPIVGGPEATIQVSPMPASRFAGQQVRVLLKDIQMNGAEQLYGTLSYTSRSDTTVTTRALAERNAEQNEYTLTFQLPADALNTAVKQGSQTMSLTLSNEFGNNAEPVSFSMNRDTVAPVVEGLTYSWNEETNKVTLMWDSVEETGNPDQTQIEYRSDESAPWTAVTLPRSERSYELPEVYPNLDTQIQIRFTDGDVFSLINGQITPTPNRTIFTIAKREISLQFAVDTVLEQMVLRFVPTAQFTPASIQSLATTLRLPSGTSTNSTVPPVPQNNRLFTLDTPALGRYEAQSQLLVQGETNAKEFSNAIQLQDIVRPRGELSLVAGAGITAQGTTYYVRENNTVALRYSIDTSLEESYPVTVQIRNNGTLLENTTSLTNSNGQRTQTISLPVDGTYAIQAVFTDSSGLTDTKEITIVKDSAIHIQNTLVLGAGNTAITTTDSTGNIYTKESQNLQLQASIPNESLETLTYSINGQQISEGQRTVVEEGGVSYVRIQLPALAQDTVTQFQLEVTDTAGNRGISTVSIRHDARGPAVTGVIALPAQSNTVSLPIANSITDNSSLQYLLQSENGTRSNPQPYTGAITLQEGNNSFRIVFLDSLSNETVVSNSGGLYSVFIDALAPVVEGTVTISPSSTKERSVQLNIPSIREISPNITYLLSTNQGVELSQGTISQAEYTSGKSISVDIATIANRQSTLSLRLTDPLSNTTLIQPLSLTQDETGPVITINGVGTITNGTGIGWALTITDTLSEVGTVEGTIHNLTTGERFSIGAEEWIRPSGEPNAYQFALTGGAVRPGNQYALYVTANDRLGNPSEGGTEEVFSMPTSEIEEENPLVNGPEIDPNITGSTIDVTVRNGRDIDFTVEDLPRGTQIILSYIVEQYNEQNPDEPIRALPIGEYTISITDNNGNTQTALHTIDPYYFSSTGDLNGDGFGGGITDHRLFEQAKATEHYDMTSPQVVTIVALIETIITERMQTEYTEFLRDGQIRIGIFPEDPTQIEDCTPDMMNCNASIELPIVPDPVQE